MLYWVFDIDNTLYQIDRSMFKYELLSKDSKLKEKINSLPSKKIVFTNATMFHAYICLQRIEIIKCFNSIIHRENINDMKPNPSAFKKMMLINNISLQDQCVFFDDNLQNLIIAKLFGWKTVYINKKIISHKSIDYSFSNIHIALDYFLKILKKT